MKRFSCSPASGTTRREREKTATAGSKADRTKFFKCFHHFFPSFFPFQVYYVYGFASLVLLILAAVTSCVAVVACYVLLSGEDHRWAWTSAAAGASVGAYLFAYGVHFFVARTSMTGLFQTAFFFGHLAMVCLTVATACGALAHLAASAFVRRIYRSVKCD